MGNRGLRAWLRGILLEEMKKGSLHRLKLYFSGYELKRLVEEWPDAEEVLGKALITEQGSVRRISLEDVHEHRGVVVEFPWRALLELGVVETVEKDGITHVGIGGRILDPEKHPYPYYELGLSEALLNTVGLRGLRGVVIDYANQFSLHLYFQEDPDVRVRIPFTTERSFAEFMYDRGRRGELVVRLEVTRVSPEEFLRAYRWLKYVAVFQAEEILHKLRTIAGGVSGEESMGVEAKYRDYRLVSLEAHFLATRGEGFNSYSLLISYSVSRLRRKNLLRVESTYTLEAPGVEVSNALAARLQEGLVSENIMVRTDIPEVLYYSDSTNALQVVETYNHIPPTCSKLAYIPLQADALLVEEIIRRAGGELEPPVAGALEKLARSRGAEKTVLALALSYLRRAKPYAETIVRLQAKTDEEPLLRILSNPDKTLYQFIVSGKAAVRGDDLLLNGVSMRRVLGDLWLLVGTRLLNKARLIKMLLSHRAVWVSGGAVV